MLKIQALRRFDRRFGERCFVSGSIFFTVES
jgi:hypothetical protein